VGNSVTAKDFYLKGLQYSGRNEHDKAIVEYTQATALDPYYADVYIARNFSYRMTDKYEEAVADMSEAIRLQPKKASHYSLRAQYIGIDDLDRALADYDMALTLLPDDYSVYWAKAELLFKAGRYADAISEYREFLQKAPSAAGVATKAALVTVFQGGLLDPMGVGKEARSSAKAAIEIRHRATERIQLCEALLKPISLTETPRSITNGMSKNDVLQIVLPTDKIVGEELQGASYAGEEFLGDSIVTFSRTGSFEDRSIS
jgi:tetratricopeptide (TPR) repeat protein